MCVQEEKGYMCVQEEKGTECVCRKRRVNRNTECRKRRD